MFNVVCTNRWNFGIVDTFGPAILSFIPRLSCLWRLKYTSIIEKGPQIVSFIVNFFFYCVLYSECPFQKFYRIIKHTV